MWFPCYETFYFLTYLILILTVLPSPPITAELLRQVQRTSGKEKKGSYHLLLVAEMSLILLIEVIYV